jgi:hypothetical protein
MHVLESVEGMSLIEHDAVNELEVFCIEEYRNTERNIHRVEQDSILKKISNFFQRGRRTLGRP